jgi:hypothetical protein
LNSDDHPDVLENQAFYQKRWTDKVSLGKRIALSVPWEMDISPEKWDFGRISPIVHRGRGPDLHQYDDCSGEKPMRNFSEPCEPGLLPFQVDFMHRTRDKPPPKCSLEAKTIRWLIATS